MSGDTTQPPAETLAEAVHCALKDAAAIATAEADRLAKEMPIGSRSEGTARAIAADITRLAAAALTRRAGGDAIPAGEACTCQRFPTHQANDCPAHGLEAPFDGVPHDTPKPPAGGDAEEKGWDHRYRPLAWGEVILDTDECRRDDGTWVTGICVGQKAPDPAYTSHRVYRRLVEPARGGTEADRRYELAVALFQAAYGARLVTWSDTTRDYWLKRADAALALPAPVLDGLHPIQTVEGLKRLWKIGVETGRILQAHESVFESTNTESSSERSTCNAPLQVVLAIEQAVARFACTNWDDAAKHDLTREILMALGLDTPDVERRWNHFDVARDMLDRSYGSGLDAVTDARRTDPIAAAIHNAALVTIVRALKGSHR